MMSVVKNSASDAAAFRQRSSAYIQLFGRALLSAIFLISGFGKLAAPTATAAYITAMGLPLPLFGVALAVAVELTGGMAVLLGYRTRFAALTLGAFCLITGAVFHHQFGDQNQLIHFLKNLAMAGGLLQVAAVGAGAISLDRRFEMKHTRILK